MCPILGLPDQPKVFNSGFRADTKVFNAGFNALQKTNKQTKNISSMLGLHDKPTLTPKFFNSGLRCFQCWLQCSTKKKQNKKKKNKPTLTLQAFNVGYNPTSLYILKRQRCSKLGLDDKPTLTLKLQCWLQCSTYQTQTNNDISSPFSILGSIPHHYT